VKLAHLLVLVVSQVPLVGLVAACSSTPSTSDKITVSGPSTAEWSASTGGVEPVFERHCGTFDCHGNPARALRIYGQNGLRQPNEAGILPGTAPSTAEEVAANYRSVISVEPEKMNDVVKNSGDPYTLLLLKKPLGIENHKGGTVMNKQEDPEKCITSWIQGKADQTACTNAALPP
jgi:hypothetical protein